MSEIILSCRNIAKTFQDGGRALKILSDLNLELKKGELISIQGTSGSGKSTLLNILGLMDQMDDGDLEILGLNTKKFKARDINKMRNQSIGYVFQNYHLLPEFTCLENVLMPFYTSSLDRKMLKILSQKALQLIKLVGLENRTSHKPNQLSGGEKQRVSIARALLFSPELLLCDEPTGQLDQTTGKSIITLLMDLQSSLNTSMILVTHDPIISSYAHKEFKLENGRLY
ncbi:MAG: lipoprotein-releasing system ATP-binding protein LolD [Planctomycetota bacterium]|nr:MAG: lipoprotein-releasing system ATP-binding protein LolD [Planctomycetota bacterium]